MESLKEVTSASSEAIKSDSPCGDSDSSQGDNPDVRKNRTAEQPIHLENKIIHSTHCKSANRALSEPKPLSDEYEPSIKSAASNTTASSDDSDPGLLRHDWEKIEQIPDTKFKKMLEYETGVDVSHCHIGQRFNGGFNHIVFMFTDAGARHKHYVVRVPSTGTQERWQKGDAHNMKCEVSLLKYLYQETRVPVPQIITFDSEVSSAAPSSIGAPFVLMKRLPGQPSQYVWYDDPEDRDYATTSNVSLETEAKRQNMLRSLARIMSELQGIQFDQIGMPNMFTGDELQVTASYKWKDPKKMEPTDLECDTQIVKREPFKSSKDYMLYKLDKTWPLKADPDFNDQPEVQHLIWGIRKILDIIYAHPVIAVSKSGTTDADEPESFVLRHPDLEFQNILTDPEGNVTGIIDWEGCLTAPRCAGYASVPDFLRRDWDSGYDVLEKMPYMDWQIDRYIQIYADAIRETGCSGAIYTRNSAMYRAIVDAVNDGSCMNLIEELFKCIPAFRRVEVREFAKLLGKGCLPAEEMLKTEIGRLLEPANALV